MHPYEIHATIHTNDRTFIEEKVYLNLTPPGLKVLRIENYSRSNPAYAEVVTQHVVRYHNPEVAVAAALLFKEVLQGWNIRVKRLKIEVPPNHPWVAEKRGLYFEAHVRSDNMGVNAANELGFHASAIRGKEGLYFTMRERDDTFEDFNERLQLRLKHLAHREMVPSKPPEVEYCIFDDNETLDNAWMR